MVPKNVALRSAKAIKIFDISDFLFVSVSDDSAAARGARIPNAVADT